MTGETVVRVQQPLETVRIDLTPQGLKTAEGEARVSEAIREQDGAILDCANLLGEVLERFSYVVLAGEFPREMRSGAEGQRLWEVMREVEDAVKRRRLASENFLRAVSGMSPVTERSMSFTQLPP